MTRSLRALLASLALIATVAVCAPPRGSESAYALSGDEAVSLICRVEYAWNCEHALAVSWRESNWQPSAYNGSSGTAGLFQIHPIHGHSLSTLFDPIENIEIAYRLWETQGWRPWRP